MILLTAARFLGAKGMIAIGIAAAVALTAFGLYRAGGRAERATAAIAQAHRLRTDLNTKRKVQDEIVDLRRSGVSAVARLRSRWAR